MLSNTITSTSYIKSKIDELVSRFPLLMCRYEHNESSRVHFIETVPSSKYYTDEHYLTFEEQVVDEFEDRYPYEIISFITDDSVKKISNPIYTNKGVCFEGKKEDEYLQSIGIMKDYVANNGWVTILSTQDLLKYGQVSHHTLINFEDLDDGIRKDKEAILEMALINQGHCCNIAA